MAAYVIANIDIRNQDEYGKYSAQVPATLEAYGGRFIVRGGVVDVLEGEWNPRVVVIEFPDSDSARRWYHSKEYQSILPVRLANSEGRVLIAEGTA